MAHTGPGRQPRPGDILLVRRMKHTHPLSFFRLYIVIFALLMLNLADNFDARGDDELTLRPGDKIELIELDEGFGDGWYLGKHAVNGRTGLFPGGKKTL